MTVVRGSLALLAAGALASAAFAQPLPRACGDRVLQSMFDRALEARDDHFMWDGIDDRESYAELSRYIARLQGFLDAQSSCELKEMQNLAPRAREQLARAKLAAGRTGMQ